MYDTELTASCGKVYSAVHRMFAVAYSDSDFSDFLIHLHHLISHLHH